MKNVVFKKHQQVILVNHDKNVEDYQNFIEEEIVEDDL